MAEPIYTAGEKARTVALVARAAVRLRNGRSTAAVDKALARIDADAQVRGDAVEKAREAERRARIEAQAAKRAARKFW